jgi:TATA-box binding protein (TBP) (component of TFIID and TFIIIB)
MISPDDFKKYPRYTITHVGVTNWKLDHIALFQYLEFPEIPIDPLINVKRADVKLLPKYNGSVLQVKYKDVYKVVHVRGYGATDIASIGCFSNSTTILMYVDKLIVLKVPSEGKIQIAGCRTEQQVHRAIHYIWRHIQRITQHHPEILKLPLGEVPKVIFHTAMNNISFKLGFNINKRKVHELLYKDTEFNIIPNDKKYAGVTAKLEVTGLKELPLVRHRFIRGRWYSSQTNWIEYLSMISPKDRIKKGKVERFHTFLIFHSGRVIQSGPRYELMEDVFRYFVNIMLENRDRIEDLTVELIKKKSV